MTETITVIRMAYMLVYEGVDNEFYSYVKLSGTADNKFVSSIFILGTFFILKIINEEARLNNLGFSIATLCST